MNAPALPGLVAELSAGLAAGGDLPALLQRFLAPVVGLCGAQAGAVRMLSADGRRLDLIAEHALPAALLPAARSVERDCGVCGRATAGAAELAWSDPAAPCVKGHRPAPGSFARVLAVPLAYRGQVLGLYNLFFDRPDAALSEPVAALLKTFGELLGLALHKERLEREQLRAAVLAERQHMAAELHDSVAQSLYFAKMRLLLLDAAIERGDSAAAHGYCTELRGVIGQAHAGLRELLTQCRAPAAPGGFRGALEASRAGLQQALQIEVEVEDRVPELQLDGERDLQVHRIVQEALANVARHAGARHAWITIERRDDALEVVVDDDGCGLPAAPQGAEGGHFGLGIMRERAARLGGRVEVLPRAGGGTRVRLRMPVGLAPPPVHEAPALPQDVREAPALPQAMQEAPALPQARAA
ncbi:MAG: GAF domain-containing protein [Burkholderiales bacterium]|nr:GAF domain-containing protein [Burkholderiales bacterium]